MPPVKAEDYSGVKIVVIGKPGTGKSTLVQSIIAAKSHIAPCIQVYNGTEEASGMYGQLCPKIFIHDKFDLDAMVKFAQRQRIAIQYLKNPWAIQVIDDCTDDPKQLRHPLIQSYYKNGRHWKMIHLLCLQYSLDILPSIRNSIDYTFILRESSKKSRKKLYENYCPDVVTEDEFYALMNECTEDYGALVICNRTLSNKVEDCIFYYKADPSMLSPTMKVGHKTCWQFHVERYNEGYIPDILGPVTSSKKK